MCSDKQNFCSPISESYMKFKSQGKKARCGCSKERPTVF